MRIISATFKNSLDFHSYVPSYPLNDHKVFNFRVQTQCFQFRTADVELQSVDCAETMILATAENSIMLPDSFEGRGLYRLLFF